VQGCRESDERLKKDSRSENKDSFSAATKYEWVANGNQQRFSHKV
jgi:hypothetical protein